MRFGSTFLLWLRLMLVGIWFGLYWVLFSFFDHYIQSSVQRITAMNFSGLTPPGRRKNISS